MTVSLRWIGGATLELRFGAFRVLTDPVLAEGPIAFYMDGPQRVVPVHHHTFSHYTEPVTALVERPAGTRFSETLRVAEEGEVVVLVC
jgi:L-ascorbate metabolism protein UlaG (beta-lactamase superfamily)